MDPIEHRFSAGRYVEVLLRFDGRILEYFNLYDGSGRRMLVPETRLERSGPDRKGAVT
jgi:hypothetical protein